MENKRKVGVDIIRASAILFVLSVHFFLNTSFYQVPVVGKSMYLQVFMRMMFIICVPLFMILTGYLQRNKQLTSSYYKKIIPILIIYLVYSILSIIFRITILKEHKSIIQWIASIENFSADTYSWYIEMYIGLFLIGPCLNLIYNNLNSKKQKNILIIVSILMTACPAFFNGKMYGLLNFPNYWSNMYPIMYYFIGCYIHEYKPKIQRRHTVSIFFFIVILETVLEIYSANSGVFSTYVGYYGSLTILIQAIAFFLTFYDVELENKLAVKTISLISVLSLDIYLVSKITDTIIYTLLYKYYPLSQQNIIMLFIPIVFCTFILAFTISYLRNKFIKVR